MFFADLPKPSIPAFLQHIVRNLSKGNTLIRDAGWRVCPLRAAKSLPKCLPFKGKPERNTFQVKRIIKCSLPTKRQFYQSRNIQRRSEK